MENKEDLSTVAKPLGLGWQAILRHPTKGGGRSVKARLRVLHELWKINHPVSADIESSRNSLDILAKIF